MNKSIRWYNGFVNMVLVVNIHTRIIEKELEELENE